MDANMETHAFSDRLINAIHAKKTSCIVGLDPSIDRMPTDFLASQGYSPDTTLSDCARMLVQYNKLVLDNVYDLVPAIKPQSAYYERYGSAGIQALEETTEYARSLGLLVILDAKRGDIGSTSEAYAKGYLAGLPSRPFEYDAMTLHPYLGKDSLDPFVTIAQTDGKGLFICVLNSNPGAIAFQTMSVGGRQLFEAVAEMIKTWTEQQVGRLGYSNIGAVVGASAVEHARTLRRLLPRSIFLVPGMGAQGGSLDAVRACFNHDGNGAIISSSRAIMYPEKRDSAEPLGRAIRYAAENYIREVDACLGKKR